MQARTAAQAAAEKRLDHAFEDGGPTQQWGSFRDEKGRIRSDAFKAKNGGVNQRVWMLANKGEVFLDVLEAPEMLGLVGHVLGEVFQLSSFTANIAKPGSVKMDLHTDRGGHPIHTSRPPVASSAP